MIWKKSEIYQALKNLWIEDYSNRTVASDESIFSIQFDSRKIIQSDCFVAILGANNDGHNFVVSAHRLGAKLAIVNRRVECEIEQIVVTDTLKALHWLSYFWRQKFDVKMIAITGSNGKTTTKHILAQILGHKAPTLSTYKNFNNEYGVPITLFELQEKHAFGVVEIGARKLKDIEQLAGLVNPQISIITNVNEAHLKSFKSIEVIAQTKAEIYQSLKKDGVGVVNLDDKYADFFIETIKKQNAKVLTFSKNNHHADIFASSVFVNSNHSKFNLRYGNQSTIIETNKILGSHNISNMLAACCICFALNIPITTLKVALENACAANNRLEVIGNNDKICLIDDTYNANPASMQKAIEFLDMHPKPKIMVMGDMFELDEKSDFHHQSIGKILSESEIEHTLLFGEKVQETKKSHSSAKIFSDINLLNSYLNSILENNPNKHTILVKGSRIMQMERVIHFLKEKYL